MKMVNENLLSLMDVAKILGLSICTIRRYAASGRLKTIHFSQRTVRVTRAVLDDILLNGLPHVTEAK